MYALFSADAGGAPGRRLKLMVWDGARFCPVDENLPWKGQFLLRPARDGRMFLIHWDCDAAEVAVREIVVREKRP